MPRQLNPIYAEVVGVTEENFDGTSRQSILKKCRIGDRLDLRHIASDEDEETVGVFLATSREQLGWLVRELAHEIAPRLRKGGKVEAEIIRLPGGGRIFNRTRRCHIKITPWSLTEGPVAFTERSWVRGRRR
jgi:hypothetical protein